MASLSLFTILAVVLGYSVGLGSALRLDVFPELVKTMVTKHLDITCVSNGPEWVGSVVSFQIMKKGENPIVVRNIKGLTKGVKWKENFETQSDLKITSMHNFLKLTIKNPDEEDTGTYVCRMYYKGRNMELLEVKAEANVTDASEDINIVVNGLLEKVTTLEKNVKDLKAADELTREEIYEVKDRTSADHFKMLAKLNSIIKHLEKAVKEQSTTLMKQKHTIEGLEVTVKEQKTSLMNQKNTIEGLEVVVKEQKTTLVEQEKNLKELKKGNGKAAEDIGNLQRQSARFQESLDIPTIAFSYGYTFGSNAIRDQSLKFGDKILDEGNNYNPSKGSFVAPIKGLYVFHLVVTTKRARAELEVNLKTGDGVIASCFAGSEHYRDQTSLSTMVMLKKGQAVTPVVSSVREGGAYDEDRFSYFAGYLLRPI